MRIRRGIKKRIFPVLALDFANSMIFKIFCDPICARIGCNILLIDSANRQSFLLVDFQLAIHQFIAVGGKAAVPLALSGLLDTTSMVWTRMFSRSISATADRRKSSAFPHLWRNQYHPPTQIRLTPKSCMTCKVERTSAAFLPKRDSLNTRTKETPSLPV